MKINRRNFLTAAALSAPAALIGDSASPAVSSGAKPLKVCVFADIHYRPGTFPNSEDTSFLERILARAEREHCDMMIHLGDFVHNVRQDAEKAYLKLYNDFKIPGYHILGNHDQDGNPYKIGRASCRERV